MPTSTPWGTSDSSTKYGRGIVFYTTPGHGGFHVSPTLLAKMPEPFRRSGLRSEGWFEEDCDYALVMLAFPDRFKPEGVKGAHSAAKDYYPDEYREVFGVEVKPEESHVLRERAFKEATKDQYVAKSAFGDWKEGVPPGMVGVVVFRASDGSERGVLVPEGEYTGRNFVADLSKYAPWFYDTNTKRVY